MECIWTNKRSIWRGRNLKPGMVITNPANIKHWHGAKRDSGFSHIAVEVPGKENSNEWLEALTDEEYNKLKNIFIK